MISFAACAVLLSVALLAGVAQRVDRHQRLHVLLAEVARRSDDPQLASFRRLEPSWVFYNNRSIPVLYQPDGRDVNSFLRAEGDRFVIATEADFHQIKDNLPAGVVELARAPYFLRGVDLVLLGNPEGRARTAGSPRPQH
jgi:hypothetical protein